MRALAVRSVECARVQAHCAAVKRTTPSLNREVIPRCYWADDLAAAVAGMKIAGGGAAAKPAAKTAPKK